LLVFAVVGTARGELGALIGFFLSAAGVSGAGMTHKPDVTAPSATSKSFPSSSKPQISSLAFSGAPARWELKLARNFRWLPPGMAILPVICVPLEIQCP
jgi:hypothetical protein